MAAGSGGKALLKPASVRQRTTVQSGDVRMGFTPSNGWGFGVCVVHEPQGITAMLSNGTFCHGGEFGTQAWVDPKLRRIYILIVQRTKFPNSDDWPVRLAVQKTAALATNSGGHRGSSPAGLPPGRPRAKGSSTTRR
jgi:CubicO group peptidase (beta-lactamase class C family)